MKLSDVKHRIDNYFDKIDAHELYDISISKYNFIDYTSYTVSFKRINVNCLSQSYDDFNNTIDVTETGNLLLAA
ncbi:hypothetical protein A1019T_02119 [Psychrobacter pasteurii]|uniref:Uncharacterized protein n=1 Tax=Psychrobacter pasteurii TaxID=1945520 RepID=A0A1R4EIA1_9GAMM|nr:hypothetical protein [Psychrobacter pasteurii]SJM38129.1 hypothetical protein A1019T_02119 [Psychrobacter pasteurii]